MPRDVYTTNLYYYILTAYNLHLPIFTHLFFFFNDTPTTEIYTLSLHDALPISASQMQLAEGVEFPEKYADFDHWQTPFGGRDRKSTRLNSSHSQISYAVFCLKKKKQ